MVLKRVPSSRGAFGVHWTQWFFPSLAASAIYRKFFKPTALALDIAERERILRRLSMAYMLLGWTMVGGVFYYFVGPVAEEEQLDSEGKRVAPALKHSIRLVDPGDLKKGSKVSMIQVGGPYGWSFEKKDITESTLAGIEARERQVADEASRKEKAKKKLEEEASS